MNANITEMTAKQVKSSDVFRWIDTPWTVAIVVGLWGVMIGIEEYKVATVCAAFAVLFSVFRFATDTLIAPPIARVPQFIIALVVILALFAGDLIFTAQRQAASDSKAAQLSKLDQIPELQKTIRQMTANEQETAKAQVLEQGKLEQRMSDIGEDNTRLKASIEKKDAVLAKIAQEQFELNFSPQVLVTTNGAIGEVFLGNNGKTNIQTKDVFCERLAPLISQDPRNIGLVPPNSSMSYRIGEDSKKVAFLTGQASPEHEANFPCRATIITLDKRKWNLTFTWSFDVNDKEISRAYATNNTIEEAR